MHRLARLGASSSHILRRRYATPAIKTTTGVTGLQVHPDPLPRLLSTYQSNLELLRSIPEEAVYRQSLETLLKKKIKLVDTAINGAGVQSVEGELQVEHIELALEAASDELNLTKKMLEWKPWEPLQESPAADQWVYFGEETRS